jgi:hypothetical protein
MAMTIWLAALAVGVAMGLALGVSAVVRASTRRRAGSHVPLRTPATVTESDFEETVRHAVTLLRLGCASRALRALEDALQ